MRRNRWTFFFKFPIFLGMERNFIRWAFLLILIVPVLSAREDGIGLGFMLGEPTGVTGKAWVSEHGAFDVGVGWSFDGDTSLHVHANYLWHLYNLVRLDEGRLPFYIGLGARYKRVDSRVTRTSVVTTENQTGGNGNGENGNGENGNGGAGEAQTTTTFVEVTEDSRDRVGIRVPVGVSYLMPHHRVEIFGEVAPVIDITPTSKLSVNASVGIRFYF